MREIRFTVTVRERVFLLVIAASTVALGTLVVAVSGVPAALALIFLLNVANSLQALRHCAVLTPQGITYRRFRTRHVDWHDIASVERYRVVGNDAIRLRLTDGKVREPAVPRGGLWRRDPEFDAKFATMWNAWAGATGRAAYVPGPAAPEGWWAPAPVPDGASTLPRS